MARSLRRPVTRSALLVLLTLAACIQADTFRLDGDACLDGLVPLISTPDSARAAAVVDRLASEASAAAMAWSPEINDSLARAELARVCAEHDGQTLDEILADPR